MTYLSRQINFIKNKRQFKFCNIFKNSDILLIYIQDTIMKSDNKYWT